MNDSELRAYLLGRLPEADAGRIEERLLEDEEFFLILRSLEDDLHDEHARGRLDAADSEAFLARYAGQADRRAFARALSKRGSRPTVVPISRGQWLPLAAAAALVVAIGGITLLPQRRVEPEPVRTPVAAGPSTAVAAPAVVLTLGASRAGAATPEVTLVPNVTTVPLLVRLDPEDRFDRYSVELRSAASDRVVWRDADLRASTEAGDRVLRAAVPRSLLGAGAYELAVRGQSGAAPAEDLGFVTLRVRQAP